MKKLIAFDLDGTLTQHRSPLEEKNKKVLDALSKKYRLCMVGAGDCFRIYTQMNNYPIDIVGNYGMQESTVVNGEFTYIRQDKTAVDEQYFLKQADYIRNKYGYTEFKGDTIEFHQSGMVTFPFLGTKADVKDKIAFDPTREKRKAVYPEVLKLFPNYSVYIGGSSSFDFSEKRYNKYDATMAYAKKFGITKDEILFVGDDFGDGGGDSHIRIFGIDYIEVKNYEDIPKLLKDYI